MMYGCDMCLIDATYRTTLYELLLVCLCVATNVAYCNVATMLLVDEKSDTIAATLRTVASWNPGWKPKYFMSDFHEGQISAVEATFPGVMSCSYQCTCKQPQYASAVGLMPLVCSIFFSLSVISVCLQYHATCCWNTTSIVLVSSLLIQAFFRSYVETCSHVMVLSLILFVSELNQQMSSLAL